MSFVIFRDQKSFMQYFRQLPGDETAALYKRLVEEEYMELEAAWQEHQHGPCAETATEIADACLDLIYVATGLMHALGLDPQPLWNEVHRSNIDKIKHPCPACNDTGDVCLDQAVECASCGGNRFVYEVRRREDGKVMKPVGWQPPQLLPLVRAMLTGQWIGGTPQG